MHSENKTQKVLKLFCLANSRWHFSLKQAERLSGCISLWWLPCHVIQSIPNNSFFITIECAIYDATTITGLFWSGSGLLHVVNEVINTCNRLPFQMGSNYKAALIPQRIRETIHGWGKETRRKRRLGIFTDDSTIRTETSTVASLDEDDQQLLDSPRPAPVATEIELQPLTIITTHHSPAPNENSSRIGTPLLRPSATISSALSSSLMPEMVTRSNSMPTRKTEREWWWTSRSKVRRQDWNFCEYFCRLLDVT